MTNKYYNDIQEQIVVVQGKVCMHSRNFTGLSCSEDVLFLFPTTYVLFAWLILADSIVFCERE